MKSRRDAGRPGERRRAYRPLRSPHDRTFRFLPAFLQRPLSGLVERIETLPNPPRHSGSAAALAFLGAFLLYGLVAGGHLDGSGQTVASRLGFAVDDLELTGNRETSEIDLIQALELDGTTSLLTLDIDAARQAVIALPWVEDVKIQKIYPGKLSVSLAERQPFGLWQHGERVSVIEADGNVVAPLENGKFASLPLFVGLGAEQGADAIFAEISLAPWIADQVRAFVRIGERRWDLRLRNGVVVRLPEEGISMALERLAAFDSSHGLLSRDIASVDLRLDDRLAVGLNPEAAEKLAEDTAKTVKLQARMGQML